LEALPGRGVIRRSSVAFLPCSKPAGRSRRSPLTCWSASRRSTRRRRTRRQRGQRVFHPRI